MACKAPFSRRMNRIVRRPRPAAEAGALIIAECLVDFVARIHYERPILHDAFANRTTLQNEEFALIGPVLEDDFSFGIEVNRGMPSELPIVDFQRTASEKIHASIRTR